MVEADEATSQGNFKHLTERLDRIEELLRMQTARLYTIEQSLNIKFQVRQQQSAADLSSADKAHETEERKTRPISSHTQTDVRDTSKQEPVARVPEQQSSQEQTYEQRQLPVVIERQTWTNGMMGLPDVETLIGGNWFNWIGIIALTFGIAFFLKYAVENEWIGPTARVMLGAASGLAMLTVGEAARKRGVRLFAYVLSGGGILVLYLSIYAAYNFYKLIEQLPAFLLMMAVTTIAVLLSAKYDAFPIAILALLGGFLTPILISTGRDNQAGLFGYIALLDAGVLALAYFKQWRSLNFISFVLTALTFFGWILAHYNQQKLWVTIFFLSFFFLLFTALAIIHNILKERYADWADISLILANAGLYFGTSYILLDNANYDVALGSFALIISALYVLLFYLTYSRHRADKLLTYSYLGIGITFFTMAIAIQLDQQWVTIGWATEAATLTWIGLRSNTNAPRRAALIILALSVIHWLAVDAPSVSLASQTHFVPFFNRRAFSCAALVISCSVIAWLYAKAYEQIEEKERTSIIATMTIAANALALLLLSIDVNDYYERQKANVLRTQGTKGNLLTSLENAKQLALTVIWTIYGGAMLVFGIIRKNRLARLMALLLLGVTTLKVFFWDLASLERIYRIISFILLGGILLVISYFYQKSQQRVEGAE